MNAWVRFDFEFVNFFRSGESVSLVNVDSEFFKKFFDNGSDYTKYAKERKKVDEFQIAKS